MYAGFASRKTDRLSVVGLEDEGESCFRGRVLELSTYSFIYDKESDPETGPARFYRRERDRSRSKRLCSVEYVNNKKFYCDCFEYCALTKFVFVGFFVTIPMFVNI